MSYVARYPPRPKSLILNDLSCYFLGLTCAAVYGKIIQVMRAETRAKLGKQGAEIASVRGTMQALVEGEWMDKGYIQRRIQDLELRLINVQCELADIEFESFEN